MSNPPVDRRPKSTDEPHIPGDAPGYGKTGLRPNRTKKAQRQNALGAGCADFSENLIKSLGSPYCESRLRELVHNETETTTN